MKKKIIGVAFVAAIAVAAGWSYNQSKNEMGMSNLALANVEALAKSEIGEACGGCSTSKKHYCCTIDISGLGSYTLNKD